MSFWEKLDERCGKLWEDEHRVFQRGENNFVDKMYDAAIKKFGPDVIQVIEGGRPPSEGEEWNQATLGIVIPDKWGWGEKLILQLVWVKELKCFFFGRIEIDNAETLYTTLRFEVDRRIERRETTAKETE